VSAVGAWHGIVVGERAQPHDGRYRPPVLHGVVSSHIGRADISCLPGAIADALADLVCPLGHCLTLGR